MTGALQQKIVNALMPEASMAPWAKLLLFWAVYPTIRSSGGLWVGGTLSVGDGEVRFAPNAMNRVFHAGDVSFSIRLADIQSVRVEPATFTNIVVITTGQGERRVRCYGAEELAAGIDAARANAA